MAHVSECGVASRSAPKAIWVCISHSVQQRGHYVYLLGNGMPALGLESLMGRIEENDRYAIESEVGLIAFLAGLIGVIACDDKQGVLIPRLRPGIFEEAAERVVEITYALVHRKHTFGKRALILLWNVERMMRGCRENGSHEWLVQFSAHRQSEILQKRFVPDGPQPIEIFFAVELRARIVFCSPIIMLEP